MIEIFYEGGPNAGRTDEFERLPDAIGANEREGDEVRAADGTYGPTDRRDAQGRIIFEWRDLPSWARRWDFGSRDGAMYATHAHDDVPEVANLVTDVHGYRRAQCSKCDAVFPIDRDHESRATIRRPTG